MRRFILPLILVFSLTACGYRTPLTLPKPQTKPSADAPAPGEKP